MGFDGLPCPDPHRGMDFDSLRKGPASELCPMGDIDADLMLGMHSRMEIQAKIKRAFNKSSARKGYIFGTCSGIPAMAHPGRVKALYRAAQLYSAS